MLMMEVSLEENISMNCKGIMVLIEGIVHPNLEV